jgi:hypothetical protein
VIQADLSRSQWWQKFYRPGLFAFVDPLSSSMAFGYAANPVTPHYAQVSNFAQTPSSRILMQHHSLVRQKFGYFRVIAITIIVTAALCWGFTHI